MNLFRSLFGFRRQRRLPPPPSPIQTAPLPPVERKLPADTRIYAVGDIHGRLDCLLMLETIIARDLRERPRPLDTQIIFVGDYVDRGPDSRGVLNILSRGRFAGLPIRCLMGNHEEGMLQFLEDPVKGAPWLAHGGLATLTSYGIHPGANWRDRLGEIRDELDAALPAAHRAFLSSLQLWIEMDGFLFVHAGIKPGIALDRQRREHLLWIREPFLSASAHGLPWAVVHGHTIVENPLIAPSRISLDTGAYATGRLTCVAIEGSEVRVVEA